MLLCMSFLLIVRLPPRLTLIDTLFPYAALFLPVQALSEGLRDVPPAAARIGRGHQSDRSAPKGARHWATGQGHGSAYRAGFRFAIRRWAGPSPRPPSRREPCAPTLHR